MIFATGLFLVSYLGIQGYYFVIDPVKNAALHNEKGIIYLNQRYYLAAIQEFKIAIALCHDSTASATFYNNLGMSYMAIGRYSLAEECFIKSIEISPNFIEYYKNLVKTYKLRNSLKEISAKYEEKIGTNNFSPELLIILGLIYKELNRKNQAVNCLETFKKLHPGILINGALTNIINELQ